ncbi:hypothetical protein HAZT_HAZT002022 [Hyalella azteca]|uniref:Sema domain-containing protein n=1 Tax=Hyalella azteca TaxID=294128 RepID=A0A6A0H7M6_HYAAZ|nr:hypothetical protein HAZT_HAZT002022 [Hyalella azteca]
MQRRCCWRCRLCGSRFGASALLRITDDDLTTCERGATVQLPLCSATMGDLSSWHEKSVSCSPHAKKFSRISSLYSKTDKIPVTLTPKECRLNFEHSSSMPHAGQSDATNSEPAEESLSSVEAVFSTGNESIALQHVVYNTAADVLYLGGTNRLYEVTADNLEVKSVVETGPRFDSARCHASGCGPESSVSRALSDNINKVLVLDPAASTLIMCGSVSQGACHKFRTANVSLTPEYIPRSVAANDPHSSTYAFVGPERYKPWGGSEALYVGTTFTAVGDYRHDVPAVSTRNLYDLDYAESSFLKQSLLRIDVKYRDHFLVKYVYGFNASDFAYFVTVQKKSHLPGQEETGYISRLARTCITDANYDSYTEITMTCEGRHGSYNLVQDAKLASAGADLAASMGIHAGDPILVATFAPSVGHTADAENAAAVLIDKIRAANGVRMGSISLRDHGFADHSLQPTDL